MNDTTRRLSKEEVARYSRQLLVSQFGVKGQLGISNVKVVIVGAGGLGCPVALYLAGAGVQTIGVVDYDEVTIDNLHRQIAFKERMITKSKVESLKESINELNSTVKVVLHNVILDRSCALNILKQYDIVLDCTDNAVTRYLLNDACVFLGKPLVSGSALRWEGQLTVYNYINERGEKSPCYRCLFPVPCNPAHVTNCSEGGVLGPVVGVIGSLQALEVLKIAGGLRPNFASMMYLFDGMSGSSRTITLRSRNKNCSVCGDSPSITELIDYEAFCDSGVCDKVRDICVLSADERVTATEYARFRSLRPQILLDTRPAHEFEIASLEEAKNIELDDLRRLDAVSICSRLGAQNVSDVCAREIYVICHRGNDSQLAVEILKEKLPSLRIRDISGGYEAWATEVDQEFPRY